MVQEKARELADRCAVRLRANGPGHAARSRVKIRTSDFRTLTRSRTLATPTDVGRELFLAARELLAGVDLRGLPVRLVGVRAEGLSRAATSIRQPTLDEASDAAGAGAAGRRSAPWTRCAGGSGAARSRPEPPRQVEYPPARLPPSFRRIYPEPEDRST